MGIKASTEDRAHGNSGVFHARQVHIDAVYRAAINFGGNV